MAGWMGLKKCPGSRDDLVEVLAEKRPLDGLVFIRRLLPRRRERGRP
jgi:hypothetical protein